MINLKYRGLYFNNDLPLHLYHEKGFWLIEGFNLRDEKTQVFSVDYLLDVKPYETKKRLSEKEILKKQSKEEESINLVLIKVSHVYRSWDFSRQLHKGSGCMRTSLLM